MIEVVEVERTRRGDAVELGARVRGLPRAATGGERAWIRLPAGAPAEDRLADGAAWTAAMLPTAVALGVPLRVEAPVPARMLAGARKAMSVWHGWSRLLRPVEIAVEAELADERSPKGVGCFFSGGVDSSYSVLKSLEGPGEQRVTELILVRGFDIRLADEARWAMTRNHVAATAAALGLELAEVETNLRTINDPYVAWGLMQHGPLLAAIGLALSGRLRRILIPATSSWESLYPWGSHPALDPLWSTEAVTFVHDGCEATRPEKVAWQLADSEPILSGLRVCYQNGGEYNCGRCGKCQRTMVALLCAGALERTPTFAGRRPDPELVAADKMDTDAARGQTRWALEALRERGIEPEIQAALAANLRALAPRLRARRGWLELKLRAIRDRRLPALRRG